MSLGNIIVNGDQSVKFEPAELLHDPWRGMSSRHRAFAPLNSPGLLALMRTVQSRGGSGRMVFDTGDPHYEYELPGLPPDLVGVIEELFYDRWDLAANEQLDSIFSNPRIVDTVNHSGTALIYNDKIVLSRMIRDNCSIAEAVASCNADLMLTPPQLHAPAPGSGTYGGGSSDNKFQPSVDVTGTAQQVFKDALKGQSEYENPVHVLTHCTICSPESTYNVARANEMRIYTPAQLLTEISSGWTYNCPARLRSEIAAIPQQFAPPDEASFYLWGWLKKLTRSSPQTNFMIECSTEYICGLWPRIKYAAAV